MANKRALELGRRLSDSKEALLRAMKPLGDGLLPAWRWMMRVERAAIAVGEHRERVRRAKRMGRPDASRATPEERTEPHETTEEDR